jgi:thiosulfate/3-mercaptopyruvate sulfurtransferase
MGKYFSLLTIMFLAFLTVECNKGMPMNQGILVSTDWLENQLNDPSIVVLHAGSEEGFDTIHIPGARLIIPGDFTVSNDSLRNELPPMDSIVNLLKQAGVNKDSRIVLCYESEGLISRTARVFVTLRHAGLAERTKVLNGGMPEWLEEKRETSDEHTDFSMGSQEALAPVQVVISSADLERDRWSPDLVVIDTRSDDEYRGTPATMEEDAEGGHIEGAYFLPYENSFEEEKSFMFKSDSELEKLFRDSGMDRSRTTVVYCGSGIRASSSFLAASHLGYPVLLYDGSYQEWDRLDLPLTGPVDLPVEND